MSINNITRNGFLIKVKKKTINRIGITICTIMVIWQKVKSAPSDFVAFIKYIQTRESYKDYPITYKTVAWIKLICKFFFELGKLIVRKTIDGTKYTAPIIKDLSKEFFGWLKTLPRQILTDIKNTYIEFRNWCIKIKKFCCLQVSICKAFGHWIYNNPFKTLVLSTAIIFGVILIYEGVVMYPKNEEIIAEIEQEEREHSEINSNINGEELSYAEFYDWVADVNRIITYAAYRDSGKSTQNGYNVSLVGSTAMRNPLMITVTQTSSFVHPLTLEGLWNDINNLKAKYPTLEPFDFEISVLQGTGDTSRVVSIVNEDGYSEVKALGD